VQLVLQRTPLLLLLPRCSCFPQPGSISRSCACRRGRQICGQKSCATCGADLRAAELCQRAAEPPRPALPLSLPPQTWTLPALPGATRRPRVANEELVAFGMFCSRMQSRPRSCAGQRWLRRGGGGWQPREHGSPAGLPAGSN